MSRIGNIKEYIYDDYIFNRKYISSKEILNSIDLLIDNGLGCKITGQDDLGEPALSKMKVASKFIIKYNKSIKKNIRGFLKYEYGSDGEYVDEPEEIRELNKYCLEPGEYYAELETKKSKENPNYMILKIEQDTSRNYWRLVYNWELYIIGDDFDKIKNKFLEKCEKYEKLLKSGEKQQIVYADGRPPQDAIFKSFDKLIFKDKERILNYIDNWKKNIPKFYEYGIIPKLSIILYGNPGTGKSTFAKALANYLDIKKVYCYSADSFHNEKSDGRQMTYFNSISVIDDIDCICKSREDTDDPENSKILQNLLSFLDEPPSFYYKADDGLFYPVSIVVATTNYYNKLDGAVKRHGRFDLKIEMTDFEKEEAMQMTDIYNLTLSDVVTEDYTKKNWSISPAQLQALCLENINKSLKEV